MTTRKPTRKKTATKKKAATKVGSKKRRAATHPAPASIAELEVREIEALREEIEQRVRRGNAGTSAAKRGEARGTRAERSEDRLGRGLPRWNANPEDVQRSVAQLVLALVEFLRKLLERQAIRRMEAETLSPEETERVGLALMRLEETVVDLAARFGLSPDELNLDLGPLGRLI